MMTSRKWITLVSVLALAWLAPLARAWDCTLKNSFGDIYYLNEYRNVPGIGTVYSGTVVLTSLGNFTTNMTATVLEHSGSQSMSFTCLYRSRYNYVDTVAWSGTTHMTGIEICNKPDRTSFTSASFYIDLISGTFAGHTKGAPGVVKRSGVPFAVDGGTGMGTNRIGVLLPLTGDLANMGESYVAALNLALGEITNTPGMPDIELVIEDTGTSPSIAYDKLVTMRTQGVHIVLGPETSAECHVLKDYADANDVLLLSSSSTAPSLAITNDNLMRMTIDDTHQARLLAEQIAGEGITDVAIYSRTDIYGEDMLNALSDELASQGCTVFSTNYWPRISEIVGESVTNMGIDVAARTASVGADKVAVVTILFDEGVDVLGVAASVFAASFGRSVDILIFTNCP